MQEIQLTSDNNTIHVDDVDVKSGVYAVNAKGSIGYVILGYDKNYRMANSVLTDWNCLFPTLKDVIAAYSTLTFYTIPDNKRITTTKALTVDDLKDTDHVGFEYSDDEFTYKGHVVSIGDNLFNGIVHNNLAQPNDTWSGNKFLSITEFVKYAESNFKTLYRFNNYKALYKWLAED